MEFIEKQRKSPHFEIVFLRRPPNRPEFSSANGIRLALAIYCNFGCGCENIRMLICSNYLKFIALQKWSLLKEINYYYKQYDSLNDDRGNNLCANRRKPTPLRIDEELKSDGINVEHNWKK
jgi:hypothetical protein